MATVTVDIARALGIDGWMSEQELTWLAKQAVEHRCIVEIGSYLGRSTTAMLDHCSGMVYAIDDWKGPRDVYLAKAQRKVLYNKFLDNVEPYVIRGKLKAICGDYDDLYRSSVLIQSLQPDMVFLDGSHETDDVIRDILFWKQRIVKGGLLCGHDINFPSISDALLDTTSFYNVADDTNIWYITV